MSLPTGTALGPYRIRELIGVGGMGEVYAADDTRLGRSVAIKFLPGGLAPSPDLAERFEREARVASSLNHPNICTIYDIGAHDERRFIVMELLDGESLRHRIHGFPLPVPFILDVGCQIADALEAAHEKGIVHRDIKPANIFITKRGQAKLLDFGVAKLAGERHVPDPTGETRVAGDVLTTPGTAIGSVNYMSPEQARGEALDGRTDLFSLGLVLYEMATGRQAFAGQTTAVVFDAILNRHPPDPRVTNPDLPDELQRVVLRSLEKDRRMRFQTAADMLAELSRIRRDTTAATERAHVAPERAHVAPDLSRAASSIADAGLQSGAGLKSGATYVPSVPSAGAAPPRARTRWATVIAPGALVLAAVAYYAWNATRTPALGERDTLVIADFVNTTGDAVFDDALRQAVAVQLQQTPFISLLPDQRVQQTLRLMQRPRDEPLSGPVARELCQRVGAKATVEGSIAPLGSSYVVNLGVHNCQTGEILAQQQVQARTKEDVVTQVGSAVTELRRRLGESLSSIAKYDVPVTEATTASLDALKAYGLANKTRYSRGDAAAIPFFENAIKIDPNFALAHAKLGVCAANTGQIEKAVSAARRAYELKDRSSEYERLYIEWNYAQRVQQDTKRTKDALELMIASYPRDFAARNNLGVYYISQGEYAQAVTQYLAAIELAPDEPQPLANVSRALFDVGRRDEAFAMAAKSLAIRPDGGLAVTRWMWALISKDARAGEFEAEAKKLASPDQMRLAYVQIALWHGRLNEYARLQEERRAIARANHAETQLADLNLEERVMHAFYEGGARIDELRALVTPSTPVAIAVQAAIALATLGTMEPVKAISAKLDAAPKQNLNLVSVTIARAYTQAANGKTSDAIATVEGLLKQVPRARDLNFYIGIIRERSGDLKGAEAAYRNVLDPVGVLGLSPSVTGTRVALANVLAKAGDTAGAKEQLDVLLEQWKGADTEFALLKKVKEDRSKIKD